MRPSPEKLGSAARRFVSVSLVPSDSYAEGAKGAEVAKGDFRFSVFPVGLLGPFCHFLKQVDYFSLVDEIKEDSC